MIRNVSIEEISDGKLYTANDMVKADCHDCVGCSACCRGMGDTIQLDPYDIYRLQKGLGKTFSELMSCAVELGMVDGLILPHLSMKGDACSFLDEKGRCQIHGSRPGICRLFPLGRIYEEDGFRYFLQTGECAKENRSKVKVKKWIDTPELSKYEAYIWDWHCYKKEMQKKAVDEAARKAVAMEMLKTFYLTPYDTEKDFYGQYEERRTT